MSASNAFKISPDNILEDWGAFEDWAAGNSVAPGDWFMAGTAGSVARETTNIVDGLYSMKIISGASGVYAAQYSVVNYTDYLGKTITYGARVMCSSASKARIFIDDGITKTYSSYHTGDGTFQFLTVTIQISSVNTRLYFGCEVASNAVTGYFDSAVAFVGELNFTQLQNLTSFVYVRAEDTKVNVPQIMNTFELARKEGKFISQSKMDSRSVKMRIQLTGADIATVRANYDTIIQAVSEGLKNLYLTNDRYSKVYLSSISQIQYAANLQVFTTDLEFVAPAPYEQYIGRLRNLPAISGLTTSFNFAYNGSYKTRPRVSFVAGGLTISGGISLQNLTTGESMGYAGTVAPGTTLSIDMENQTVLNNNVDDSANFTGDFFSFFPGTNYMVFAGATPTLKLDYFPRYI